MNLCSYGCERIGITTLKNGRWSCSTRTSSCPAVQKRISETKIQIPIDKKKATAIRQVRSRLSNLGQPVESMTDKECLEYLSNYQKGWFNRLSEDKRLIESKRRSKSNEDSWKNPVTREKRTKGISASYEKFTSDELQLRQIKIMRVRLNDFKNDDECILLKFSAMQKEAWYNQDINTQERIIGSLKSGWENYSGTSDFTTKHSELITKVWADRDLATRKKIFHKISTNGFLFKEYIFPSGRKVLLQGYEDCAINSLLYDGLDEEDLQVANEHKISIPYCFNHTNRLYFPDIYIQSSNTLIEVKSDYYFEKSKKQNLAKARACIDLGYNFYFLVANGRNKPFIVVEI